MIQRETLRRADKRDEREEEGNRRAATGGGRPPEQKDQFKERKAPGSDSGKFNNKQF